MEDLTADMKQENEAGQVMQGRVVTKGRELDKRPVMSDDTSVFYKEL